MYQSILETNPSDFSARMDALFIIDYQLKDRDRALQKYKDALHVLEKDSLDDHNKQKQVRKYFKRRIKKLQEEEFWRAEVDRE